MPIKEIEIENIITKFKKGERVSRPVDVFDDKSRIMIGTVTRVYKKVDTPYGNYEELYGVQWDKDGYRENYLPHGISKILK